MLRTSGHAILKKRGRSYDVHRMEVRTISSEIESVRRKLRELEDKISKIDRLDKLEARVKALEERLQKKL